MFLEGYYDVVYAANHFYIQDENNDCILKKSLLKGEPEKFLDFKGSQDYGRTIRVGIGEKNLVLNAMDHKLIAVCLRTSKKVVIDKKAGGKIIDHRCLPGGKVVMLTSDGWLMNYIYDIETRFVQMEGITKIDFLNNLKEIKCEALVICPKFKFLCVHTVKREEKASRILVYLIKENKFEYFNNVIIDEGNFDKIAALNFYNYLGDFLLLTGVSFSDVNSTVFTFEILKDSVREAKEMRKVVRANRPRKLTRIDGELVSIDGRGKVITISYDKWMNSV